MRVAVFHSRVLLFTLLLAAVALGPGGALAQSVAFKQAVAEVVTRDSAVAGFYRANGYQPLWTGDGRIFRDRRKALLQAIDSADDQGLPQSAYDTRFLEMNLRAVSSDRDLGRIDAALTELFLDYAQDVQSGVLDPRSIEEGIKRTAPRRDRGQILAAFAQSTPAAFLRTLPPQSAEYERLMKNKIRLETVVARGGWGGEVPRGKYELGASGRGVIALRNRLIAMGYLRRTATATFDGDMQQAVAAFQRDSGLHPDGVAGAGTLDALNVSATRRLGSVIAAMERERWLNFDLGRRHVWVNIADFSAAIIDNGRTTFKTRAVVGANEKDRRSPEFSDQMDFLVLNPSWFVPRSITVKEYLPMLQEDPYSAGQLQMIGPGGQIVSRQGIDFNAFTEADFPFALKEPPSLGNALGRVKFMFPNRYNIYLHDTPAKSLFNRDRRAYSHGCIRLADPMDFAYTILAREGANAKGTFDRQLATGVESTLALNQPIPVHIVYRTAFTDARGNLYFRNDVYGRDGRLIDALMRAGVAIPGLRS